MATTETAHHTAWLTNDPTCLSQPNVDLVILADTPIGHTVDDAGSETPTWGSIGDPIYTAITGTDARDGDITDAIREADTLLTAAGWARSGDWEATTSSYIATVERA